MSSDFFMKRDLIFSKFSHISKDRHSSSFSVVKNIKGSFHGHRVCVVAVIHYQEFVCLDHFETSADRLQAFDTSLDLLDGKPVNASYSSCCQCIVDHMDPRCRNKHIKSILAKMNTAGNALESFALDLIRIYISLCIESEKYRFDAIVFTYCRQFIVITIQNNMSFRVHGLKDLCFGFEHTIAVSEIFEMAGSDICDHTGIRSGDLCQSGHLAKITDSHFQNCDLIFISQAENSQRKSQFIIKVSLCLECAVFFFKYRSDHFFCAGLANTSGDPDNRDLKLFQIKFCDILHCLKRRSYLDIWKICILQFSL